MARPVPDDESELFYESFWSDGAWAGSEPNLDEQMRLDAIERLIERHRLGGRILDVGCGRGVVTSALATHGDVIGIDVVRAAIARGEQLFPGLDLRCMALADLNATDSGTFDLVVCTEVLEHVPPHDKIDFVVQMARSLGPGGRLLLTTPRLELRELWRRRVDNDQPTEDWLSETALAELLGRAGLTIIHRERIGVYPLSLWRSGLVVSPVRRVADRIPPLRRLIDRAGVYQVVLAATDRDARRLPHQRLEASTNPAARASIVASQNLVTTVSGSNPK